MKTKKIELIFLALLLIVVSSCDNDFEEINTDPNNPTTVPTSYLMTNAQRGILGQRFNFTTTLYVQHFSETQYTNTSRYETAEASFNGYYSDPLADLQQIINLNMDETTQGEVTASGSNNNQIAVAKILKVLTFQYITDMWGEIPYSQALLGRENFTPGYDTQADIYAGFITELNEAINMIEVNEAGMEGDIIYSGDMAKWQMFANALKMRVGIRMSNVNPTAAAEAISEAVSGAFASNDDDALYSYLTDAANDNPLYQHFLTRTDYAISDVMVSYLNDRNDPRLPIFADPAPEIGTIVGMPYGVSEAVAGSITNATISFPGAAVRAADTKGIIMTYAEQLFIQAEAIERGYITGNAETVYNAAITASMDYWGVEPSAITAYLNEADVIYNSASFEQLIGEQKWIALYTNGHEAWAEWRRLDYPALTPAPAAVEGREIPRRRAYIQDEYDLNLANITSAISRQGEDDMATRIWWDVD